MLFHKQHGPRDGGQFQADVSFIIYPYQEKGKNLVAYDELMPPRLILFIDYQQNSPEHYILLSETVATSQMNDSDSLCGGFVRMLLWVCRQNLKTDAGFFFKSERCH